MIVISGSPFVYNSRRALFSAAYSAASPFKIERTAETDVYVFLSAAKRKITPTEVAAGKAPKDKLFRIGGLVKEGSVKRQDMTVRFIITDTAKEIPVAYTGILPDLFRENQSVVATGRMRGKVFVAEEVLAKHDETYMPKEVADKMAQAHKKHQVQDAQPAPAAGTP